ncbi:MAG: hypothetical protein CR986_01060 [Ignavibacteriae bacterium]|nr:MAG: hypothetical protein CR986_01060 [Ignavibacteriota bacterium]
MEKTTTFNDSYLKSEPSDFIATNLHQDEKVLSEELNKRKLTLISLASLYAVLIIASFIFLS